MTIKFTNNAVSRLAAPINAGATSLSLSPGDGSKFPALSPGETFPVTVVKANGALEIMRCTARSTDVLTITRGQEGTSPISFDVGNRVELRMTAGALQEKFNDELFPFGQSIAAIGQDILNIQGVLTNLGDASTKNVGTGAGTVAAGDDSRIINGEAAHSWGNHATQGYATETWVDNKGYVNTDTTYTAGAGLDLTSNAFSVKYGTGNNEAAAGNDSRITGALQKSGGTITGGVNISASYNIGNMSGQTKTLAISDGNIQHLAKNGNGTLNAPTASGVYTIIVEIINSSGTGSLTLSGFNKVAGDSLTNTNNHKFIMTVAKTNSAVTATVVALQ